MELLRKIPLFSSLDDKQLENVFNHGITKKFKKDEFVLRHREEGDAMYLIIKGSVKLTLFNEDGKILVLSTLSQGDFFGELSLLDDKLRSCTVIVASDCELFILTRTLFFALIKESPAMTFSILKEMTVRLRKASSKMGSLALLDVYGRIVQLLYEIANDVGEVTEDGYVIDKLPTHEELANIVGATRESVSRVISNIKKTGLLKYSKDRKILLRKKIL
ncbi:MAG: Crp/Fnr family transcriptional regulator [Candidatus Anammoxibacter sp.]